MKNKIKVGEILERIKDPVEIEDLKSYKRITIRINHQGVSVRDVIKGASIGTKNQFKVSAGDFILSKIDARQGAFGIVPVEAHGGIITGNFWTYRVKNKKVNIDWFLQFTQSEHFLDLCKRSSSGNTHRKYLNEDIFLNHELDVPELDSQIKIIENIKLCRKLEEEIALLQSRVSQLIDSLHSDSFN
jgi:restriction endonuclease S subunit